jgi:diacylglycerol O-acyltransferase
LHDLLCVDPGNLRELMGELALRVGEMRRDGSVTRAAALGKLCRMYGPYLSLADATRFHMTTTHNPMEIGALLRLSGRMSAEELRRLVRERLLHQPRFQETVVEPRAQLLPRWKREVPFELDAHVLLQAAGHAVAEAQLPQWVSQRLSSPLGFERSPWQFELVDVAEGGNALLVRVHHCIADGPALVWLLGALADGNDNAVRSSTAATTAKASKRRGLLTRAYATLSNLKRLARLRDSRPSVLRAAPSGVKRVAWTRPIPLSALRATGKPSARISDVLLATITGALEDCLQAVGSSLPQHVLALVPVATSFKPAQLGNHHASVFVELPLRERDDQRRLAAIAAATRRQRARAESHVARRLMALGGTLARPLLLPAIRWFSRRASLALSNVAGPPHRVALLGHEVGWLVVFAPVSGDMCLGLTSFGYAGELRIAVQTDAALALDPTTLVAAIEHKLVAAGTLSS